MKMNLINKLNVFLATPFTLFVTTFLSSVIIVYEERIRMNDYVTEQIGWWIILSSLIYWVIVAIYFIAWFHKRNTKTTVWFWSWFLLLVPITNYVFWLHSLLVKVLATMIWSAFALTILTNPKLKTINNWYLWTTIVMFLWVIGKMIFYS